MAKKLATTVPRIALTPPEAAAAIGVGPDFFDEKVAPELRLIRRGRKLWSRCPSWNAGCASRLAGRSLRKWFDERRPHPSVEVPLGNQESSPRRRANASRGPDQRRWCSYG